MQEEEEGGRDDSLSRAFLGSCFAEDHCNYLMEILLECSDQSARTHIANVIKFVLNRLKVSEGAKLFQTETITT